MESILVVEDEKDISDMLVETLKVLGYMAVTAKNGEEGLDKFHSQSFSLIITDIRMPVMDGLTMLRTIRTEDSNVPIIVITGYPSVDSAVECLMEGADYYLVKPILMDDLEAKIKKALFKAKIQRALTSKKIVNVILLLLIPVWIIAGFLLARLIE